MARVRETARLLDDVVGGRYRVIVEVSLQAAELVQDVVSGEVKVDRRDVRWLRWLLTRPRDIEAGGSCAAVSSFR